MIYSPEPEAEPSPRHHCSSVNCLYQAAQDLEYKELFQRSVFRPFIVDYIGARISLNVQEQLFQFQVLQFQLKTFHLYV